MAVAFRLLDPEKGGFCGTLEIRSWSQEMIIVIVCVRVRVCGQFNWAHLPPDVFRCIQLVLLA